jgi:transposase
MPAPVSKDLRERVVAAYERGEGSFRALGERFSVGEASVDRWVARKRKTGDLTPKRPGGSQPKLSVEQREELRAWVIEEPDALLTTLAARLTERFGVDVSITLVSRWLIRMGFTLKKSPLSSRLGTPSA